MFGFALVFPFAFLITFGWVLFPCLPAGDVLSGCKNLLPTPLSLQTGRGIVFLWRRWRREQTGEFFCVWLGSLKLTSSSVIWTQRFLHHIALCYATYRWSSALRFVSNSQDKLLGLMLNFLVTGISFLISKLFLTIKIILWNSLEREAHFSLSWTFFFSVSNPVLGMSGLTSKAWFSLGERHSKFSVKGYSSVFGAVRTKPYTLGEGFCVCERVWGGQCLLQSFNTRRVFCTLGEMMNTLTVI